MPAAHRSPSRPVGLVTHDIFRRAAFGKHHPLATGRQAAVQDLIAALGWSEPSLTHTPELPDRSVLERFHDPDYLDALQQVARDGLASPETRSRYNLGTMECPVFPGLWERARATVGGSMLAADLALSGAIAFHPTGGTHHGRPNRASGFCYLNDPVFCILRLLDAGLQRVLYVDLDAHHGDGVEDAFIGDTRVHLVSIHEDGRWPGTGRLDDRHDGQAMNIPVPRGLNDTEFDLVVRQAIAPFFQACSPQAVVILQGADGLAGDPLSGLQLSNDALWRATELIADMAPHVVILGGGGYNPWTTARLWAGQWGRLLGRPCPDVLPDEARRVLAALTCDLVDDDDVDPAWLTSLADQPKPGPVRPAVNRIVEQLGTGMAGCG